MKCLVFSLLALLAVTGLSQRLGPGYWLGLGMAGLITLYHYRLIRDRNPADCFKAFLHNNWWGAAVFAGFALGV